MSASFPHLLDRTVDIGAPADVVFGYFTDSALWAAWWGAGSAIDPRPGGRDAHPEQQRRRGDR